MNRRQRKPEAPAALAFPPPEPADYSDEMTEEQIDALRRAYPQEESAMGRLVHEFGW